MNGAGKIVLSSVCLGFFLVLYVHGQISILQVSYDVNQYSRTLAKKTEEYRRLRYQVDQLKAPRLLETRMRTLDLNLQLPHEVRVMKVSRTAIPPVPSPIDITSPSVTQKLTGFIGRWVGVAQAKIANE